MLWHCKNQSNFEYGLTFVRKLIKFIYRQFFASSLLTLRHFMFKKPKRIHLNCLELLKSRSVNFQDRLSISMIYLICEHPNKKMKASLLFVFLAMNALSVIEINRTSDYKSVNLPQCPYHGKKLNADELQTLLSQNFEIVCKETKNDPEYFKRHTAGQAPRLLWIGCSDSRVIPEHMVGAKIGDLFVHRNIANQVNQLDQNAMAVLQYAVEYLKVQTIVVAGHYDCGGIKASLANKSFGHLESWLSQIRQIRYRHAEEMQNLTDAEKLRKLVEINVEEQVRRITRIPIVQSTWMSGRKLTIIGIVYDIETGLLKSVVKPYKGIADLPKSQQLLSYE